MSASIKPFTFDAVHLLHGPIDNDTRVKKELRSIHHLGKLSKIYLISSTESNEKSIELDFVEHIRIPSGGYGKIGSFLIWAIQSLVQIFKVNPDLIHCHDLKTLPIGAFYKLFARKKTYLIYDAHEFETEVYPEWGPTKVMAVLLENMFIRMADSQFVVSEAIRQNYFYIYGISSKLILNSQDYNETRKLDSQSLREKFQIADEIIIYTYIGGLSEGRGIEHFISIFHKNPKAHLILMGYGSMEDRVKEAARLFPNIHFHPPVAPNLVKHYISDCDYGLIYLDRRYKSFYFSLPNKLFDYCSAGLQVLANELYEIQILSEKMPSIQVLSSNPKDWEAFIETNQTRPSPLYPL